MAKDAKKKKYKKDKKKKEKKLKSKRDSSSDDDSIDEDLWVEKVVDAPVNASANELQPPKIQEENPAVRPVESSREDWLTSQSFTLDSIFNSVPEQKKSNREIEEEANKKIALSRELNPDMNPSASQLTSTPTKPKYEYGDNGSSWRMVKLRRVYETAEDEGKPVEEVALERYGSLEEFEDAKKEREFLDRKNGKRSSYVGDRNRSERDVESRYSRGAKFRDPNEKRDYDDAGSKRVKQSERREKSRTISIPTVGNVNTNVSERDEKILSIDELNKLRAKALQASLMGKPEAKELEAEFEREQRRANSSGKGKSVIVLPQVDLQGRLQNVGTASDQHQTTRSKRKRGTEIEEADEKTGISDLLLREKLGQTESFDMDLANQISRDSTYSNNLDYMDDRADRLASSKPQTSEKKRNIVIADHQKTQAALDKCPFCYDPEEGRKPRVSVISIGTKAYMAFPSAVDMVPGHCLIVPFHHASSSLECDEEVWDEMKNFMKCLTQMFATMKHSVIFLEQVINFKWKKHAVIECIPLPDDQFDLAPGFFKEAILNSDEEWSQHKKVIDTMKNGFRKSMVKNLPFFHVWFNPNGGLGHVIEDQYSWTDWFGKEVIAGMLDIPPDRWRKARRAENQDVKKRYDWFLPKWKDYDWTKLLDA
ncbi:hypothetical protein HK098_003274 [Nowakowskiella sp. JEL0407]|nr:hypothetical protein HK098_003274 [Nowakowskiella sp. JEL0407]